MKTIFWTGIGFAVAVAYFFLYSLMCAASDTRRSNVLKFRKSRAV